jgi:hypothetical protein
MRISPVVTPIKSMIGISSKWRKPFRKRYLGESPHAFSSLIARVKGTAFLGSELASPLDAIHLLRAGKPFESLSPSLLYIVKSTGYYYEHTLRITLRYIFTI